MAELIGQWLPDQRLERLQRFTRILESRIRHLGRAVEDLTLEDARRRDLLEDILAQATRAITGDRLSQLGTLAARVLTEEELRYDQHRRVLQILAELSDTELLILLSKSRECRRDPEFLKRHGQAVVRPPEHSASMSEEIEAATIYDSQIKHLIDLGLMKEHFAATRRGREHDMDPATGTLKRTDLSLSTLGRIVLISIGLLPYRPAPDS